MRTTRGENRTESTGVMMGVSNDGTNRVGKHVINLATNPPTNGLSQRLGAIAVALLITAGASSLLPVSVAYAQGVPAVAPKPVGMAGRTQPPVFNAANASSASGSAGASPVLKGGVSITGRVNLVPDNRKVSLHLRDADVRDVLNMLAAQGGLNMIVDESVKGTLTVDLDNLPINKAFEYLFAVGDLSYSQDGRSVIIATKATADQKSLNAHVFKTIPVKYRDAAMVAQQLNATLFSVPRSGGSNRAIASFDPVTNSIIVMGTETDSQMVSQALKTLDVQANRKVYTLKYNTPAYVATMLISNFFTTPGMQAGGQMAGQQPGGMAGGQPGGMAGGMAGGQMGGAQPGGMAGGQPGGMAGGMAGGQMGGAQPGGMAGGQPGGQMGGQMGQMQGGVMTSGGVTFIPEPLNGTLTVLGNAEQIALIDSVIDKMDVRRPQVSIEVSLVELTRNDARSLVPSLGQVNAGQFSFSLLPTNPTRFFWNPLKTRVLNPDGSVTEGALGNFVSTDPNVQATGSAVAQAFGNRRTLAGVPFLSGVSLQNSLSKSKSRVLANPNVVALDGTKSTINITENKAYFPATVSITNGVQVTTYNPVTVSVGISMTVTPTITNDGSVTLNLNPNITQPGALITSPDRSSTFLETSSRSITLNQVRVKDNQTLVIAGLLREGQTVSESMIPGLANMPILGAMFRAMPSNQKDRTELVLMVTPHIIREEATPFPGDPNNPGPVSHNALPPLK